MRCGNKPDNYRQGEKKTTEDAEKAKLQTEKTVNLFG